MKKLSFFISPISASIPMLEGKVIRMSLIKKIPNVFKMILNRSLGVMENEI